MHQPETIDLAVLVAVTGAAARVTAHVNDPTVLNAVTQLKSDIEGFVTSSKNAPASNPMMAMLPMLMMNKS